MLIVSEAPPLTQWDDGSIRVGGTRLLLEIVINDYLRGRGAEEIARSYPPVSLAHIYGAIAYYLKHPTEVKGYLDWVEKESDDIQRKWENNQATIDLRERLLTRSEVSEIQHA